MELKDLAPEERIAFVALLKATVMADGNVSEEERGRIEEIADEIGEDIYERALDEVERRFADEDSLKKFLGTIARPEAREVIYGTVFELALTNAVEGRESELLAWLANAWQIKVEYEKPEGSEEEEGPSS